MHVFSLLLCVCACSLSPSHTSDVDVSRPHLQDGEQTLVCVVAEDAAQEHPGGGTKILDIGLLQQLNEIPAEDVMPVALGDDALALHIVTEGNECVTPCVVQDELEHVWRGPNDELALRCVAEVRGGRQHREVEEVVHLLGLLNGAERSVGHPCDGMDSAVVQELTDVPKKVTLDEKDLLLGGHRLGDHA